MEGNIATACGTIKIDFTMKFTKILRVELNVNILSKTGIVSMINWNHELD